MTNRTGSIAGITTIYVGLLVSAAAVQQQNRLAEPFRGVTTDGTVRPNLFPMRATGVSTAPVRDATVLFLAALTDEQRQKTVFPVNDVEWRDWNNVHRYARKGVSFAEMTEAQRERAYALMRASLSVKGFETSRNIMRLNGYLAELLVNRANEYGEFPYYLTVMGTPSPSEPWGWQLDGHHLVINYFVLGDHVVMTPTFMGSEPVQAETSKYGNLAVLQAEQDKGFAFMQSLNEIQRAKALVEPGPKKGNNALSQAFNDNLVVAYAGIRASELTAAQRTELLQLISEYVRNQDDNHARVRMDEVRAHLDETYFAWVGEVGPGAVFYYRIQSP